MTHFKKVAKSHKIHQILPNRHTMTHINITHVVAFDQKHCIGKDNALAWHIPEDLKHFKAITTGGVVIMGRKTFESIGKPLPNRTNWVITRDKSWTADGVKVAHSIEQVLELASIDVINSDKNQLFIIGGGEIFRQTLPIADLLEITRIDLDVGGDAFYPEVPADFICVSHQAGQSGNGTTFVFESYVRQQD